MNRQPLQPGLSVGRSSFKPSRTFTKRLLVLNNVLAWAAVFLSVWLGEGVATVAVPSMAMLLAALFSAYAGVGHLDLRAAQQQPDYGYSPYQQPYQSELPATEPFNPGGQ